MKYPLRTFVSFLILLTSGLAFGQPENIDYSTIHSGSLFLDNGSTQESTIVLDSKFKMHISGPIADVQLTQHFENTSEHWVEGIYVFPLPDNASVRSMLIRVGDRTIEGLIQERELALQQYTSAKNTGKLAGLIEQQRPNLFTTKIANIAPGEKVSIELDYYQTLNLSEQLYSLQLPSTYTPRYKANDLTNLATRIPGSEHPAPMMELQVILDSPDSLTNIESASHAIEINTLSDKHIVSLQNGKAKMDRDFLLQWQRHSTNQPSIDSYEQHLDGEHYALFVVTPPHSEQVTTQPREVIFVLDISGSMSGSSIRAAKSALHSALEQLNPTDKFNIIAFNNHAFRLYGEPQQANPAQISNAQRYLDTLQADGGTEILEAIQLSLTAQSPSYLRQIVLITDGSVGNESEVLTSLAEQIDHARLFTVGIGSAPNTFFMNKVALMGRGSAHFINDIHAVEHQITTLLEQLRYPALTSINITANSEDTELLPNPIPDLYAGEPLIIAAKLANEDTSFTLRAKLNQEDWEQSFSLSGSEGSNAISSLWAREKIEQLMRQQWQEKKPDAYKDEIIELSQQHQILSQYTSFIAVESKPVRHSDDPLHSETIKSLLPAGNQMIAVNLPQGATDAGAWLAIGLLILIINTLFRLHCISTRVKS